MVVTGLDPKAPQRVLSAGVEINIDGRPGGRIVSVYGDDACPQAYWSDALRNVRIPVKPATYFDQNPPPVPVQTRQ